MLHKRCLVGAVLSLCGCAGYWTTNSAHNASFEAGRVFGETSRPLRLGVVVLGTGVRNTEASQVIEGMVAKIERGAPPNRAFLSADCGIAAEHINDLPLARRLLDLAVQTMCSVSTDGAETAKVMSLKGSEADKVFKGEPHERAVALLYRGLLCMADGDVENAQACFKAGALQDALAAEAGARADWLSHDLLLLECKRLQNSSDADEWASYIRKRYEPGALPAGWDKLRRHPVIVVVAAGDPPVKVAGKDRGDELQYKRAPSRVSRVRLCPDSTSRLDCPAPVDDCYVQAVTRGRRKMDDILAKKAGVKGRVEGVGSAAAFAAPLVGGAGALALGMVKEFSWTMSDSIDSSADVRQLKTVPGTLFLAFLDRSTIQDGLAIQLVGGDGRVLAEGAASLPPGPPSAPIVVLTRFPY